MKTTRQMNAEAQRAATRLKVPVAIVENLETRELHAADARMVPKWYDPSGYRVVRTYEPKAK